MLLFITILIWSLGRLADGQKVFVFNSWIIMMLDKNLQENLIRIINIED